MSTAYRNEKPSTETTLESRFLFVVRKGKNADLYGSRVGRLRRIRAEVFFTGPLNAVVRGHSANDFRTEERNRSSGLG